jgi:hypothetical protein
MCSEPSLFAPVDEARSGLNMLHTQSVLRTLLQGCTNPGCQVPVTAKFCTTVPNIRGPSVWNFLHITIFPAQNNEVALRAPLF